MSSLAVRRRLDRGREGTIPEGLIGIVFKIVPIHQKAPPSKLHVSWGPVPKGLTSIEILSIAKLIG